MQRSIRFARGLPAVFIVLISLAVAGCGGGNDITGTGGGSANFTAKINGASWAATKNYASANAVPGVAGAYVITGSKLLSSSDALSITINLFNIKGTGTYPLGVNVMVFGGFASVSQASGAWLTPLNGRAGSITITTLTATRIAGTFSYAAEPGTGASGTKAVTDGQFDLTIAGTAAVVPESSGSSFAATRDGHVYVGATIVALQSPSTGLTVSTTDDEYSVAMYVNGVSVPGTYSLSTTPAAMRGLAVSHSTGSSPTWGLMAADSGSIVVTSITAARVKGTFGVRLSALSGGATGNVRLTGSFDIGTP